MVKELFSKMLLARGHSEEVEEREAAAAIIPTVTVVVPHRTTYCSECKTPIKAGNMARHNKQVHRSVGRTLGV